MGNMQNIMTMLAKFSEKYGIEAIPTVIYFDASGKELNRTQGFIGKEDFNAAVNQLLQ